MIVTKNDEKKMESGLQIVTFLLEDEIYGFDIVWVKEIITIEKIEPIPDTPDFLEGIYSLRGEVIPIVNLRKRFRLGGTTPPGSRVIITFCDDVKTGFLVDDVQQVKNIQNAVIQPPPATLDTVGEKYISGVIKEEKSTTILLDLKIILNFEIDESIDSSLS